MASDTIQPEDLADDTGPIEIGAGELAWSQAWQLPVLLLGLGLLAVGIYFALPRYAEPDYPGVLSDVEVHLKHNELEQAEQKLDKLAADQRFFDTADEPMEGHLWQLYGDLQYRQIDDAVWQGITTAVGQENLRKIEAHYRKAERLGRDLPNPALRRYATTMAALGDDAGALAIVDRMPPGMEPPRHVLVRELIESRLKTDPEPASEQVSRLIARFEAELDAERDKEEKRRQHVWVTGLKGDRLLRAGDHEGVMKLLLEGGLFRLRNAGASDEELAPLTLLLGEAYAIQQKYSDARMQLREAQINLPEGDALHARLLVAFGDIELAEGRPGAFERAHQLYRQAYDKDKLGPSSVSAIIGLGHTEANRDGRFPEALHWFQLAVERLQAEQAPVWDARRQRLAHFLRDVHVEREYARGNYAEALELLKVYEPLEAPDLSAQTLLRFAQVYEKLGERSLAQAESLRPGPDNPGQDPNLQARRIHNQDAARAFEQAARYYRRQADELVQATTEHGDALWLAAENFERAQLWDDAVKVYFDYLSTNGEEDRREQASFRIAQALLAEGQAQSAVERFRQIIDASTTSEFAKRSYVPMARGLRRLQQWDEAERLLRSVVEDHPAIGPESPYYREALVALGQLMYDRGSQDPRYYARAIEVIGDEGGAVERYGHLSEYSPTLRYMLADSLRLHARGLYDAAEQARTETERLAMMKERIDRLRDAQIYYNQVVTELKGRHPDSLSAVERVYFRNAYFYEADCAFYRGDYETAIKLYLDSATRWQDHPAALVGWVQIVNARAELGQIEAARAAHARAMELFNQIPPEAFDRPDSLMTRERWDNWLQWLTQMNLYGRDSATAEVPTPGS